MEIFDRLRSLVLQTAHDLGNAARALAEIDVATAAAQIATANHYCRPQLVAEPVFDITKGRHPVIEPMLDSQTPFIANDCNLDDGRLWLLTGPNMAGKSTFLRQNAHIAIMAQAGLYVPAEKAVIGLVDRLFSRVGAADDLARGRSTFMVEMTETANILNNATQKSLVVLDEVGRGTSTYDGMSLAWAIAEDLHERVRCRALFATHYHQLMSLAGPDRGIVNCRVAVREWGDEIVFLHRIEQGGTDRSYGLHVARLAGVPKVVLERAQTVLDKLDSEGDEVREALVTEPERHRDGPQQRELFSPAAPPIVDDLKALDLDELTPRQAVEWLRSQQDKLSS